jgi:hypothetical protein
MLKVISLNFVLPCSGEHGLKNKKKNMAKIIQSYWGKSKSGSLTPVKSHTKNTTKGKSSPSKGKKRK